MFGESPGRRVAGSPGCCFKSYSASAKVALSGVARLPGCRVAESQYNARLHINAKVA